MKLRITAILQDKLSVIVRPQARLSRFEARAVIHQLSEEVKI